MTKYKIVLTEEQLGRIAMVDEELAIEVATQQPELAAKFGYETATVVRKVEPKQAAK